MPMLCFTWRKMKCSIFPSLFYNNRIINFRRFSSSLNHRACNVNELLKQKSILDNIFKELNLNSLKDWNTISKSTIIRKGGAEVLKSYEGNYWKLLSSIYPEKKNEIITSPLELPNSFWDFEENQREFLEYVSKRLDIKSLNDWYLKTNSHIIRNGGVKFLKKYHNNFIFMLLSLYPDHNWNVCLFQMIPSNFWDNIENKKLFFSHLSQLLNIKNIREWKTISEFKIAKIIDQYGGKPLLREYGSVQKLLLSLNNEEVHFLLSDVNEEYWNRKENRIYFFNEFIFLKKFECKYNGWYSVDQNDIINFAGASLLKHYNHFIYYFLIDTIEYNWNPFSFNFIPTKFLQSIENQRNFFDQLYIKFGLQELDDWYSITTQNIFDNGGCRILKIYNSSLFEALKTVYTEHNWEEKKRNKIRKCFWDSSENRKDVIKDIELKLKIKHPLDWYDISNTEITKAGGGGLLRQCDNNIFNILPEIYPSFQWDLMSRRSKPKGYWTLENIKKFIQFVQEKFKVRRKQDWCRISAGQIARLTGTGIPSGLYGALRTVYPDEIWLPFWFSFRSKRSVQRWLFVCILDIFPQLLHIEEYNHPHLVYSNSGTTVELDVFTPSLNIAFEYQGEQHYEEILMGFAPTEVHDLIDAEKKELCDRNNILLICIPYWWDRSIESLKLTIKEQLHENNENLQNIF